MVAQARKLQDAVQRRLPDVRIVFQEGRAWQIDGPLEVCEHRGAIQATDLSAPPHGLCNEHEPRLAAPRIHEREEGATRRPIRPRPISISAFPEICCWQTRNHTPPSPGRHQSVTTNFCIPEVCSWSRQTASLLQPRGSKNQRSGHVPTSNLALITPGHMHLMVHSPLPAKHKMERNLNP
jgi:hypothetical protein